MGIIAVVCIIEPNSKKNNKKLVMTSSIEMLPLRMGSYAHHFEFICLIGI